MDPALAPDLLDRPDAPAAVLADVVELRAAADLAEAKIVRRACDWADLHPALDGAERAFDDDSLPAVAWDAAAELALALGISHESGVHLIHEGLELRHRLPRI